MKRLLSLVVLLGLAAVGCGGNACDDAKDKLDECKVDTMNVDVDTDDCDGTKECQADCVNDASCSDFSSTDPNNKLFACLTKCGS